MKLIKAEYECNKCNNKGYTVEQRKVCCTKESDTCCGQYIIEQEQQQCICSITPFDIDIPGVGWEDMPF